MGLFSNDKNENLGEDVANERNGAAKQNLVIQSASGIGEIQISANALASIIRKAVLAVEDVTRFAPSGLVDGIADVFSNRNYDSSIGMDFQDDGLELSLAVILRFGCNIRKVVNDVQDKVRSDLENMADAKVKKINVLVKDLEEKSSEENDAVEVNLQ